MYVPELYAQKDMSALHGFMRRYSFATLVTQHDGEPFASHVPVLVESRIGAQGGLIGHMARNNPQFQDFASGGEVLAIFHGPHAYVSPAWYEPNPMAVPTWNYLAVHAYGTARILEEDELDDVLQRQTDEAESGFPQPWKLELTGSIRERMRGAIAGFEITLHRIEGKFKLNQNRSEKDRRKVTAHLAQSEHGQGVAEWMKKQLEEKETT